MRQIIPILCAMMISFNLLAQKTSQGDFRFGIVTGLNIAFPVGSDMQDFSDEYDDDISELNSYPAISSATGSVGPRFGGHFGGVFDVFFIDNLAINFGTIFSMKGFCITRKIDWDNSYFSYSIPVDKQELTISTKLNYFDIPIGIKYVTPFGLEMSGGTILSILAYEAVDISENIDLNNSADNPPSDYYYDYDDINDYEDMWDAEPKTLVFGVEFAIGYTIADLFNISMKIQKTEPFGEMDDEDENENLTLQLSTGFYF